MPAYGAHEARVPTSTTGVSPIGSQVVIRDKYDYIFRKFRRFDGAGGDYGGIYRLETMDVVNETFCNLASSVSSGVGLGL